MPDPFGEVGDSFDYGPWDDVRDRFWVPLPRAVRPSLTPYQVVADVRHESPRVVLGDLRVTPRTAFAFPRPVRHGIDW